MFGSAARGDFDPGRSDLDFFVSDMLQAATEIVEFTDGRDFAEIGQDKLLRSGIYYQFIIIGEALSQLRNLDRAATKLIQRNMLLDSRG